MSTFNPVPFWRRLLVGVAGAAGGLALVSMAHSKDLELAIPVIALFTAAIAIHFPSLGPQLFARAVWWANLGLGAIICILSGGHGSGRLPALTLTVLCAFALLAVGKQGLGEAGEREGYAPAAFRSSLLLLMVLALADAQTFLLFIVLLHDDSDGFATTAVLAPAVVAYIIGFVGLFKVAPWGAVLNAATSALLFVVTASQITPMDSKLRGIVLILTGAHAIAAAPMLFSLFTGRALPQVSPRIRSALGAGVVLMIAFVSALTAFGFVDGPP